MRILITGGCGFIGTNFIQYLLKLTKKINILNIDKLSYYSNTFLTKNYLPRYTFKKIDITDWKGLKNTFKDFSPDIVVNFAAQTHVDRSFYEPESFIRTNVIGVEYLFELSMQNKVKKFIHISTDEIFGELQDDSMATETGKNFNPSNPYSASKACAEIMLMALHKSFKYPISIIRTNNNYGPYQFPEKFIPLSILLLLKNSPLPIYGDGMQKRRWLYVDDFCNGLKKILFLNRKNDNKVSIYHLGTATELYNLKVATMICKLLNKPDDYVTFIKDRPSHDRCYALNCSATAKLIKWQPKIDFVTGLRKTVDWYLKNISWLDKISKSDFYVKYLKKHYNIILK